MNCAAHAASNCRTASEGEDQNANKGERAAVADENQGRCAEVLESERRETDEK